MLLGCCHCGEDPSSDPPPSESTPSIDSSSESQSQSDSASDDGSNPYRGCSQCIGSVAPAVMKATIGYTGTGVNPCCAPYNQPSYLLYPIVGCDYGSNEQPCSTGPFYNNRVLLQYTGAAIRVTYVFFNLGTASLIRWQKAYSPGTLNCLETHTLEYVRLNFFAPALPRRWSNLNLCDTQNVPQFITVGPA